MKTHNRIEIKTDLKMKTGIKSTHRSPLTHTLQIASLQVTKATRYES